MLSQPQVFLLPTIFEWDGMTSHKHGLAAKTGSEWWLSFVKNFFKMTCTSEVELRWVVNVYLLKAKTKKVSFLGWSFPLRPRLCFVYFETFFELYFAVRDSVLLLEPLFFLSLSFVATQLLLWPPMVWSSCRCWGRKPLAHLSSSPCMLRHFFFMKWKTYPSLLELVRISQPRRHIQQTLK